MPLTLGKDLKSTSALNFNFSLIPKLKNNLNNMIQFLIMSSHYKASLLVGCNELKCQPPHVPVLNMGIFNFKI